MKTGNDVAIVVAIVLVICAAVYALYKVAHRKWMEAEHGKPTVVFAASGRAARIAAHTLELPYWRRGTEAKHIVNQTDLVIFVHGWATDTDSQRYRDVTKRALNMEYTGMRVIFAEPQP